MAWIAWLCAMGSVLTLFILQTTLIPWLDPSHRVDTILILVIYLGWTRTAGRCMVGAAILGYLTDLHSGSPPGFHVVTYMLLVGMIGLFSRWLFPEGLLIEALVVGALSILLEMFTTLTVNVLELGTYRFLTIPTLNAVWGNTLVAAILLPVLKWGDRQLLDVQRVIRPKRPDWIT